MKLTRLLLIAFITLCLAGCGKAFKLKPLDTPMVNISSVAGGLTLDEVQDGIIKGCTSRGWTVGAVTPGAVEAGITVRGKHTVDVTIVYSTTSYSINYKSSTNMHYTASTPPKIHRKYNSWVLHLSQSINETLISMANTKKL